MSNSKDIERIEAYLNNELSASEMQAFEQQLKEDDALATEFERHQTAHKALDFVIVKNLKEQLQNLEDESKVVSINKRRRFRMYVISAAASVLLVIGFFALPLLSGGSSSTELAEAYYEVPEFRARRSAPNQPELQDGLSRGLNALKNSDYTNAVAILDSISTNDPYYINAQYFLAHAHYLSGQYNQAQESFDRVIAANDIRFQEDAEWYGLMACLRSEADCTAKVNAIANNESHPYFNEAVKIRNRSK